MAGTRQSARLLEAAEREGVKVIAVGDPGQLASVQAGGWLAAIARELGAPRLIEVLRQRDPAERKALGALHDRIPRTYLEWANENNRIHTHQDPQDACRQAATEWGRAAAGAEPGQVVMIARENDTRAALNNAARELWRTLGRLGAECAYGGLDLASGDRVICRRNDRILNVDNGTRGTITALDADRVLMRTDSGALRELPAAYVAEHLEHAYALTGHGMQGGTVEKAFIVASPRDLTAGWSYTALSRARADTHMHIHPEQPPVEREEHAPAAHTEIPTSQELLARAAHRMLERDDEDLASLQLKAQSAGNADVVAPDSGKEARSRATGERAPALTHADRAAAMHVARMRELRASAERLESRLAGFPRRELQRLEDLEERSSNLDRRRHELGERLARLPAGDRGLRRVSGAELVERNHLNSALDTSARESDAVRAEMSRLTEAIGDVEEHRREQHRMMAELGDLRRNDAAAREELVEREIQAPSGWVHETFGDRPDGPRAREIWEKAVRHAADYRARHLITDPTTALGERPATPAQQRHWDRVMQDSDQSARRLGRSPSRDHVQPITRER